MIPVVRVPYDRFATAEEMASIIEREYLTASFLRTAVRLDQDGHSGVAEAAASGLVAEDR